MNNGIFLLFLRLNTIYFHLFLPLFFTPLLTKLYQKIFSLSTKNTPLFFKGSILWCLYSDVFPLCLFQPHEGFGSHLYTAHAETLAVGVLGIRSYTALVGLAPRFAFPRPIELRWGLTQALAPRRPFEDLPPSRLPLNSGSIITLFAGFVKHYFLFFLVAPPVSEGLGVLWRLPRRIISHTARRFHFRGQYPAGCNDAGNSGLTSQNSLSVHREALRWLCPPFLYRG